MLSNILNQEKNINGFLLHLKLQEGNFCSSFVRTLTLEESWGKILKDFKLKLFDRKYIFMSVSTPADDAFCHGTRFPCHHHFIWTTCTRQYRAQLLLPHDLTHHRASLVFASICLMIMLSHNHLTAKHLVGSENLHVCNLSLREFGFTPTKFSKGIWVDTT